MGKNWFHGKHLIVTIGHFIIISLVFAKFYEANILLRKIDVSWTSSLDFIQRLNM